MNFEEIADSFKNKPEKTNSLVEPVPEPGPDNIIQYGPLTEEAWLKHLSIKREHSIMKKYKPGLTIGPTASKKIVIEEEPEEEPAFYSELGPGPKVIRINDSEDTEEELQRLTEKSVDMSEQVRKEKYGSKLMRIFTYSKNKLIYAFREEAYKSEFARNIPPAKSGLRDLDHQTLGEMVYFQDDGCWPTAKRIARLNYQYYKHQYSLNMWHYAESFVLHFLQIGVLGPFIYLASLFHWPYFNFFNNMEFFACSNSFFLSSLFWLFHLLAWLGHFYFRWDSFDFGFLSLFLVVLLARCSVIAAKYATFTADYRRRYIYRSLSPDERRSWLMVKFWAKSDPIFVEEQIELALRRLFIDRSTFKVSFIEHCSDELHYLLKTPPLTKHFASLAVCEEHREFKTPYDLHIYYDCKAILYQLIQNHFKQRQNVFIMPFFLVLSLVWTCFPGFARLETGLSFLGDSFWEQLLYLLSMLVCALFFSIAVLFFRQAYMDYDRINYMLRQLTQMFSPTKLPHISEKFCPTINLVDVVSLQSWLSMRKLVHNYGVNFHNRHKIYIPMCLALASCCGLLVVFCDRVFPHLDRNQLFRLQCPLAVTYVIFGLKFVVLVRICQRVNENSETQIKVIREVQHIIQDLHHFKDYYIGDGSRYTHSGDSEENPFKELPFRAEDIFTTRCKSRAHEWINFKLSLLLGPNYEGCNAYLKKLTEVLDEVVRDIQFHEKRSRKTLFGVKVMDSTFGAAVGWYVALGVYGWLASFYLRFD